MRVAAIVPAAGKGRRLGAKVPKAFVRVGGKTLLAHTLERLARSFRFDELVVVGDRSQLEPLKRIVRSVRSDTKVVAGGRTRAESVLNGLRAVSERCDWVLVHDAARPMVSSETIRRTILAARRSGGAISASPVSSTVKNVDRRRSVILGTQDRSRIYFAHTPQVFSRRLLLNRYRRLGPAALARTDEAALFDGSSLRVALVEDQPDNLKITTPLDLTVFRFYLGRRGGKR